MSSCPHSPRKSTLIDISNEDVPALLAPIPSLIDFIEVCDFDLTISSLHTFNTPRHLKTTDWKIERALGNSRRVALLRRWWEALESQGAPLIIASFGYTREIVELLLLHDLLRLVTRVYGRGYSNSIELEVWSNREKHALRHVPLFPGHLRVGKSSQDLYDKWHIVEHLRSTALPRQTRFMDDDLRNVAACNALQLPDVACNVVGLISNGLNEQQLTFLTTLALEPRVIGVK